MAHKKPHKEVHYDPKDSRRSTEIYRTPLSNGGTRVSKYDVRRNSVTGWITSRTKKSSKEYGPG